MLLKPVRCSRHCMNWTELTCNGSTQLRDAFIGHGRHDFIGCSETGSDSAESVRALWTLPLECACSELREFSSVHVSWTVFTSLYLPRSSNEACVYTVQCNLQQSGRLQQGTKWEVHTIRNAIYIPCAQSLTWVSLIYRTQPTTKKWKTRKLKSKNGYAEKCW